MNVLWQTIASEAGATLTEEQGDRLGRYLDLLIAGNERMNLTRITDRAGAEVNHVADALTVLPYLPKVAFSLADVGTGGGVPGIPLAVARPDGRFVLIESTKKKAAFLKETVKALGLKNVEVLDERAEDVGQGKWRESFGVAVARAVAEIGWLAEWCLPLVKPGGKVLAMKGPKHVEELEKGGRRAVRMLGGGEITVHGVKAEGLAGHVIVEIPKAKETDPRYPRAATDAKGKMLG